MLSTARHRGLLLVPLLAGVFACRTPSTEIPIDELESGSEDGEARTGTAAEAVDPLPVEAPADLLPAEVAVMAEAVDPAAVLRLITKLDKYPEFQQVRGQLESELGADLLDPGEWQALGLDSSGPVGIGLLDIGAEGFFIYASLTDEAAFERFMFSVADLAHVRERMSSAEVGRGRVYRFEDELSVVVREGVAILLFVDDIEHAPRDFTAVVATIDPREALSHTEGFAWAHEQLEDADDGLLFLDPNNLIAQIEREEQSGRYDYGVNYTQDELDRARAAGESAELIRELEARLEEERVWQRERRQAKAAERELFRRLFGPVGAIVAAAELRDDAIDAHGRVLIPGEGLLAKLFVPTEAESPLLRAVEHPPVMVVDGHIDMQALVEIAELMAKADGVTLQAINIEARAELGVDLLGAVVPALTGAGGVMVTRDREVDTSKLGKASETLGLAAYAELAQPDAMRLLIDAVVRSKRVPELQRARRGDGWLLKVPDWRDVHLSIVGTRLVASTDAKLAKRIRDAEDGAQAQALADPSHPLRGSMPTPSLRMYQEWLWLAIADARDPWKQDAESMLYDMNSHGILDPEAAAKVPRSREFKRKLEELQELLDELDELQRRQAAREFERELDMARSFGDIGMQVDRLGDGVGVHALWRMAPNTTPLELGFRLFFGGWDRDDGWADIDQLMTQVYQVRDELNQIRQADLDAAAAKQH